MARKTHRCKKQFIVLVNRNREWNRYMDRKPMSKVEAERQAKLARVDGWPVIIWDVFCMHKRPATDEMVLKHMIGDDL